MFVESFEKAAELSDRQQQALAAGAAGVGTYAFLRRHPGKLIKVLQEEMPKSKIGRFLDRVHHGADKVVYNNTIKKTHIKQGKYDKTMLTQHGHSKSVKVTGGRTIGSTHDRTTKGIENSKLNEYKLFKKHAPEFTAKTEKLPKGQMTIDQLRRMVKNKNFIIKRNASAGSSTVLTRDTLRKYLKSKPLYREQHKEIQKLINNPNRYIKQDLVKLHNDPSVGKTREIRVHAVGNKVMRGASDARWGDKESSKNLRAAEDHFQQFLDKAYSSGKLKDKNIFWAPDIGMKKGRKGGHHIIELNAGPASSGFLDPKIEEIKSSSRINRNIYKGVTGNDMKHVAAGKAVATGSVGAGLFGAYKAKKESAD